LHLNGKKGGEKKTQKKRKSGKRSLFQLKRRRKKEKVKGGWEGKTLTLTLNLPGEGGEVRGEKREGKKGRLNSFHPV